MIYNILFSVCVNRGLGDEVEMVFRIMNESGVLFDIIIYIYVVEIFGKLGKFGKVSDFLKEMEMSGNLFDILLYNVLLEVYVNKGFIKEVMGVFR